MKNSTKIILSVFVAVVYTIVYALVIYLSFSNISLGLKIGLYFVFLAIIIVPMILIHRKVKDSGEKNQKTVPLLNKTLVNLDINYKSPLITKCRCGFVLIQHMKTCPQCGRPNLNYTSDVENLHEKKKKNLL